MYTTYVVVTLIAVAANLYAAYVDFMRAEWVVANMTRYGIPNSWLFWLGGAKAVGAAGLIIGFWMPRIGVLASFGLVVYFLGAVATVMRSRWYTHLRYPAPFLLLALGSLVLRLKAL